jgi:hypothetical protein
MKEKKFRRVMYVGHPSPDGILLKNIDSKFKMHGLEFERGVVYPVSDGLFDWASHIRGFAEVIGVTTVPLDFPHVYVGSDLSEMQTPSGLVA